MKNIDLSHVDNLSHLRNEDEQTLQGTIRLFGQQHHFQAIRVQTRPDGKQEAVMDPHKRFEDMQRLYEGAYRTVTIPGYEGEWAICIFPFAD